MNRVLTLLLVCCLLFIAGCNSNTGKQEGKRTALKSSMVLKYAKGFTVDYYDGCKVITVRDVKDTAIIAQYVLLHNGTKPAGLADAITVQQPFRGVVCISTSHIAEMAKLGLTDSIAAVVNIPLLYDTTIVGKVNRKQIVNLGNDEINYEKLVELSPGFVITSGGYDGGDKLKLKLNSLHITSVVDLDYKEQDPLGRAEWLKYLAAFYDKENEADSIFKTIESNYLALKLKAAALTEKPTVFCNIPFKEIWYMPCGENYMAKLIEDAGGDFLWKNDKPNNLLNLNLDYELVYNRAASADYWLNPGFANSLNEIKAADRKNALFRAFKEVKVYNNNKRNTPSGGFDFWETGAINPDKILADLIFIFHPELLPGHQLYYYQKLK